MTINGEHYFTFPYTKKQIQDIEKFCSTELEALVLAFVKFYNRKKFSVHQSCYAPFFKKLENILKVHSEVNFTNQQLKHLKKIGVDLKSTIFNGFSNIISTESHLVCVHHLKIQEESKLLNLLGNTRKSAAKKNHVKGKIVKDIYGSREGNY